MIEDKTKEQQPAAQPVRQPRRQKLRSLWAQLQCRGVLRRHRLHRKRQHRREKWLHKLLRLIDADNDRFPNGCAFRVVVVVKLQGIPDMKAVALCQLFRNHAHITILHTDHAPFFHCHIAGQNIEIQFHFSVS